MTHVSNVDFVRAALGADSTLGLAEATGLALASVRQRCAKLRKLGVNLPRYARNGQALDVDGLNAIIAESKGN